MRLLRDKGLMAITIGPVCVGIYWLSGFMVAFNVSPGLRWRLGKGAVYTIASSGSTGGSR